MPMSGTRPHLRLHDAEPGVGRGDADVGAERDLQAAAEDVAVQRRDDRHRQVDPVRRHALGDVRAAGRARAASSIEIGPDMSDAMSRPEQKLGPSPCSTTARTPGVAATSSAAASRPSNIAPSSALCLSGRVRVTVATWSATSTRTRCSDMPRTLSRAVRENRRAVGVRTLQPPAQASGWSRHSSGGGGRGRMGKCVAPCPVQGRRSRASKPSTQGDRHVHIHADPCWRRSHRGCRRAALHAAVRRAPQRAAGRLPGREQLGLAQADPQRAALPRSTRSAPSTACARWRYNRRLTGVATPPRRAISSASASSATTRRPAAASCSASSAPGWARGRGALDLRRDHGRRPEPRRARPRGSCASGCAARSTARRSCTRASRSMGVGAVLGRPRGSRSKRGGRTFVMTFAG